MEGFGVTPARQPARRFRFPLLTVPGFFRLVFAVVAVLVVAAAVIIGLLIARGRTAADQRDEVTSAQAQAYRLQAALVDQEIGVRGYAITGDTQFLQPYTTGRTTEADAVARLRSLTGRYGQLKADLEAIEQAAAGWRRAYAVPLIALGRHGPLIAQNTGTLTRSTQSFSRVRALFSTENTHLAAASAAARAATNHVRALQIWVFVAILLAFLLVSAAVPLVLQYAVVRPLNQLRENSRHAADGDLSRQIESAGPADLRAVASDVEAMRSSLAEALHAARSAQGLAARQAADLHAQATELRRSNADLEQFAYVASHDLQEPLRKIASFCQLLEKRYGDKLDDRGHQYVAFAVDGAKRMQTLINDLLAFSRVGRADDTRVRVPLDQALDDAIGALGSAIEQSGAVIERPGRLPAVIGDPTLLTMLWQNLLSNAIKFREPSRPAVVTISAAEQPGGYWKFCVTDNGVGIPPEFAEKIFVIFQRLHSRDSYPGTGIGLAICKKIAEHHGGTINLDTSYADGTRICFTIPPAGPDQAGGTSTAAAEGTHP